MDIAFTDVSAVAKNRLIVKMPQGACNVTTYIHRTMPKYASSNPNPVQELCSLLQQDLLSVVSSSRRNSIARHRNILHNNRRANVAGSPDPRSGSANTTRDLKEVVRLPRRLLPRGSLIRAHLELRGPPLSTNDLGREPVLRDARLHVDFERAGDVWARDVVPSDVDDAYRGSGEVVEGGGEEVEVVGAAAGAFVDDLAEKVSLQRLGGSV